MLYNRINGSEPHTFEQSQAATIPFLPERTNRPHNIIFNRKIQNFYFPEQTKQKLFSCRHLQQSTEQLNWPKTPTTDKLGDTWKTALNRLTQHSTTHKIGILHT
jgi:hypothetical protein